MTVRQCNLNAYMPPQINCSMAKRPFLVLVLLLLAALPSTQAQSDPSTSENTLWFHVTNEGGCCAYWMNNLKEDPDQTIDSVGLLAVTPGAENPGAPIPDPLFWPADAGTLTMPLDPELSAPVLLDPAGTIEVVAFVGGAGQAAATINGIPIPLPVAGQVDIHPVIMLGDQLVAEGAPQTAMYAEEWVELHWSLTPGITTLDPAIGPLAWTLVFNGAANAIVVSASDDPGWTSMTLPVKGATAPVTETFEELTAPTVRLSSSYTNSTTRTAHYNWTTTLTEAEISYAVEIVSGTATLKVMDGTGAEILNKTLSSSSENVEVVPATAGDWSIVLDFDAFAGNLTFGIGEPPSTPPASSSSSTSTSVAASTTSTSSSASETESVSQTTTEASKDSPLPTPGLVILAVAGLAIALRRRLH